MPSRKSTHDYHLAQTDEVTPNNSPKISILRRLLNIRILLPFAIFGTVSFFIIGMYIRPLILQSEDNESLFSNTSENISTIIEEIVDKEEVAKTQHEKIFEDSLSPSQKDAIDKLRLEIEDKVTNSYMRTASYLIRWLKARNWDLEDAKEMLLDHLEWRVEYDMDSVLEANFTFFEKEYPVFEDGIDYQGGPVISFNVEDWDIRRVNVGGYEKEFFRYFFRLFERGAKLAENFHARGINITQGMCILNFQNYSLAKHGCFPCIPILTRILFGMDDNYPGWLHNLIFINTTEIVNGILEMLLPYLSGENRAALQVYGLNKAEWQQRILSLTSADQIRPEFGGTKVDSEALNEI